jgi:hypothetical protein
LCTRLPGGLCDARPDPQIFYEFLLPWVELCSDLDKLNVGHDFPNFGKHTKENVETFPREIATHLEQEWRPDPRGKWKA